MVINQAALRGLDISYNTSFNKAFSETQTHWKEVATQMPSSTAENSYKWVGQLPGLKKWIGEREIRNLDAYGYTIRNEKYEDTISIPRDAIEDDQYGVYAPSFSSLGEVCACHPEELVFGVMKDGFTAKAYDGKTFYASDHPVDGRRTASNVSDMKLSEDSFKLARETMMSYRGDSGRSLGIVPDLLVVSPHNEEMGDWILNADYHNGSSNLQKGKAKLLVSTELAGESEDMWFLLYTRRTIKPFIYQLRRPFKLTALTRNTDENVFLRDEYIWGVDGRDAAGYSFWQMAYGSTGEKVAQG